MCHFLFGSENWSVWASDGPFQTFSSSRLDSTGPRAVRTRLESSVRHLGPNLPPVAPEVRKILDIFEFSNFASEEAGTLNMRNSASKRILVISHSEYDL